MAEIQINPHWQIGRIDPKIYGNFIEHLGRCIYGGIYEPGSPLSNKQGYRKDVLEVIKRLNVPILRWPGGNFASGYHWWDGIGPRESRPSRRELAWHTVESNEFGTDEFIEFCRQANTEPYICVNMGNGSMDEGMNWVEYCNGAGNTFYANLRRQNGHPKPYGVKYWGLGNEIYGNWQIGYKDAQDYAKAALEFAKVMKWTDPSIKLVACGGQKVDWDWEVLNRCGHLCEYISAHFYWGPADPKNPLPSLLSGAYEFEEYLKVLWSLIQAYRRDRKIEHPIQIALDEWNVWYRAHDNVLEEPYDLSDALAVSIFLNMMRRNCNAIGIANLAQLINVLPPIVTSKKGLFLQTIYYPLQLAANLSGDLALETHVDCDSYAAPRTLVGSAPMLDVLTTLDEEKKCLFISLVNSNPEEAQEVRIRIVEAKVAAKATLHSINGPSLSSVNGFEKAPVQLKTRQIKASEDFTLTLPAHTAGVLEVRLG